MCIRDRARAVDKVLAAEALRDLTSLPPAFHFNFKVVQAVQAKQSVRLLSVQQNTTEIGNLRVGPWAVKDVCIP